MVDLANAGSVSERRSDHVDVAGLTSVLSGDLDRVQHSMTDALAEVNPFVSSVLNYLTDIGGKRLRPMLALCSASLAGSSVIGESDHNAIRAGGVVELVHVGTLYHDDVIDLAEDRRGQPSANSRWNNTVSVLAGDYLIARASEVAAAMGPGIAERLSQTIADMCRGQLLESAYLYNPGRTEDAYFGAIGGKTSALMGASCWLAPLATGADPATAESLRSFGRWFGDVYQIVDDLLDLFASEEELGKPAGADIIEGIYNLPVIYAIEEDPSLKSHLRRDSGPDDVADIRQAVSETEALSRTLEQLSRCRGEAVDALSEFRSDDSPALSHLTMLLDGLCDRVSDLSPESSYVS